MLSDFFGIGFSFCTESADFLQTDLFCVVNIALYFCHRFALSFSRKHGVKKQVWHVVFFCLKLKTN